LQKVIDFILAMILQWFFAQQTVEYLQTYAYWFGSSTPASQPAWGEIGFNSDNWSM